MLKSLLSVVLLMSFMINFHQNPIDYNPKMLTKIIEKLWGQDLGKEEIIISDSLLEGHRINGKFFKFIDEKNIGLNKYVYVGRINSCRAGGCSISSNDSQDGAYEYFDYFILFDYSATVEVVKVYNYQATHGQEVTARGWLKQFCGYKGSENLNVGKNIDAIAGATISVYAITFDVEYKTKFLQELLQREFAK